ncbi:MAG: type II toxin-antitoxin system RelB/DinJ family antitoxin [Rhizobiales bacterium]|nr:type II toxin-antitoxin system RelB/DinJ family antitoxin [Hyphomicrobiales bacterium]
MTADAVVRARIDKKVKAKAARVLEQMGLTVSDAIRLMMIRTASEKALPFQVKVPNAKTRAAMKEAEGGKLKTARNSRDLLVDLNADD